MNLPGKKPAQTEPKGPDGATPLRPMVLTGIVRTGKGYALATAVLTADGRVASVSLGHSQSQKEYIAIEHKRALTVASSKA